MKDQEDIMYNQGVYSDTTVRGSWTTRLSAVFRGLGEEPTAETDEELWARHEGFKVEQGLP